jgi:hypothetical protein
VPSGGRANLLTLVLTRRAAAGPVGARAHPHFHDHTHRAAGLVGGGTGDNGAAAGCVGRDTR